jgi:hypothetical protein
MTVLVCLLALADNCDNDGRCSLPVSFLANQARVSRATFFRALSEAERLGELEREHHGGAGPGDTSTYRLALVDIVVDKLGTTREKGRSVRPLASEEKGSQKGLKRVSAVRHKTLIPIHTKAFTRDARKPRQPFAIAVDEDQTVPPGEELAERIAKVRSVLAHPSNVTPPEEPTT